MSSSNASKSSTPSAKSVPTKSIKIKLKVPREILAKFPHEKSTFKSSGTSTPSQAVDPATPMVDVKDEHEKSTVNGDKANDAEEDKQKPAPAKPATTTAAKPRSRPGPKRRKIETEDQQPWTVTMTGPGAHRLGPKANQGAINAGLRSLDRSGNPCRKWGKRTFSLKSFNGAEWSINHWTAPPKNEVKVNGVENSTPSTTSENNQPSSNVPSVTSHQPGDVKDVADVATPAVVSASA